MHQVAVGNLPASLNAAPAGLIEALSTNATTRADQPAVITLGADGLPARIVTFAQLHAAIAGLTDRLEGELRPGSVVVLRSHNSPEYVAWFLAALAAGMRVLPAHPQLTPAELRAMCCSAPPAAIVVEDDLDHPVAGQVARCDEAFAFQRPESRPLSVKNRSRLSGDLLLQSSGTTGFPKLAVRAAAALEAMGVGGAEAMNLTVDDRVVLAVPMCHSFGVDLLLASLAAGAAMVVLPRFDPQALARCLAAGDATVFPGVPFMFESLARISPRHPARAPRLAFSAGAPLPPGVRKHVGDVWGIQVSQLYGATELGTVALARNGDPAASVGTPLRHVSMRILSSDDPGSCLSHGEEGQVAVRTPTMMSSYFPDLAPHLQDGHLLPGDLGRIDAAGRLFLTGRVKLLIDVGGLKVNPLEVESSLAEHPGVRECLVSPVALSETVNRLHAAVVPIDPAAAPTADELRGFLRDRLAPFKVPRVFELVPELPRTLSGKLVRPHPNGDRP